MSLSFDKEPALILASGGGIVAALLVLLVSFGVPITPDQKGAILTLTGLLVPIVAGIAIRSRVSPVASAVAAPPAPTPPPPHTPVG